MLNPATGIDNHGLASTGELQSQISVYAGDVLGLLESWSLTYKSSETFYDGPKRSREFSGSLAIPYGYWTLYISGSRFEYESLLQGEQAARSGLTADDSAHRYGDDVVDELVRRGQLSAAEGDAAMRCAYGAGDHQ